MQKKIFILLLFTIGACTIANAQKLAQKTNALYWLTTTPNVGVEFSLSRYTTLDISGTYNTWDFSGKTSFRHWLLQPEFRIWPCLSFTKYFIGIHGIYGKYNISEIPFIATEKDISYKGNMYGGGASFGYHFILGRRWALELELGLGYVHFDYDKYRCKGCRESLGHFQRDYVGPTKIGVSFVYMIK